MGNLSNPYPTAKGSKPSTQPRAIIHKQILNAAESNPADSMEEIAENVSGASTKLVERVLDEYGDPGQEHHQSNDEQLNHPGDPSERPEPEAGIAMSDRDNGTRDNLKTNFDELSDKQLHTLQTISEHPEATQREIADMLDVSAATISNRVNSIDEFDWQQRKEFLTTMFEENGVSKINENRQKTVLNQDIAGRVENLSERIETLEKKFEEQPDQGQIALAEPDLMHKVVHACLTSEQITEDEELQILQSVLL